MKSVFISGSINMKVLPSCVEDSIKKIKDHNIKILVGDAEGIDTKLQEYCQEINYHNVTIYSIYPTPRKRINSNFDTKYISANENLKKERKRQTEKDRAMTLDSDYSFIIWDGKSKGSYGNIIRAIENNKRIKLYLDTEKKFLPSKEITKNNIGFLYRKANGYKAGEVVEHLQNEGEDYFKNTQAFNQWLMKNNIIKKEEKAYVPLNGYENMLITNKYRGKITGVSFKNEFISWIESKIKEIKQPTQPQMF